MKVEASGLIERPVESVFRFCAREHVRNHPQWDPDLDLQQQSGDPIGIGTIIRRRNAHGGTPVEGTMEVTEFEPDRAFGVVIREGARESHGRMTFDAEGPRRARVTLSAEIPGMDEAMVAVLKPLMERSVSNIKRLIESASEVGSLEAEQPRVSRAERG